MIRYVISHSKALGPNQIAGAFRNAASCGATEVVFEAKAPRAQVETARLQDSQAKLLIAEAELARAVKAMQERSVGAEAAIWCKAGMLFLALDAVVDAVRAVVA